MLLVSVNRLTPGMVTAVPIAHPHRYQTRLVQANIRLDQRAIGRLKELKVPHAWVCHPLMEDLDGQILSRVPENRRTIYETIKGGFNELQHRAITVDDYRRYCGVIGTLISELLGREAKIADLAERLFTEGDELSGHCANVAYLAVTIGMHLEDYIMGERPSAAPHIARDLTSLGVGAMLHDIGKLADGGRLRDQHQFADDLDEDYGDHVLSGYRLLRERVNPVAAAIALHHHQRWDGAGWPDMTALTRGRHRGPFSGRRIHIFARIVAAANAFDNLTSPPGGPRRPGIYALHTLQSEAMATRFDPIVLDALLRYLPPFPTGAQVFLSNGREAAVTAMNPAQPCRPTVRYIDDYADGTDIDLMTHPELDIAESQGLAVGKWLFHLPPRRTALEAAMSESVL
ncbi:MAG: HD domain-containing protein [Planctomycetes bacterium]|nr:HD domain-containing protein [Planctomycetota bacterium]